MSVDVVLGIAILQLYEGTLGAGLTNHPGPIARLWLAGFTEAAVCRVQELFALVVRLWVFRLI